MGGVIFDELVGGWVCVGWCFGILIWGVLGLVWCLFWDCLFFGWVGRLGGVGRWVGWFVCVFVF